MAVTSADQLLDHAYRHVTSNWLPPQSEVLEKIRSGFDDGRYETGKNYLYEDLKQDISLFVYCLRELLVLAENEKRGAAPAQHDPLQLFEQAPLPTLRAILLKPGEEISKHRAADMNEAQALRVRESMLSASTAEVLAEAKQVKGEFAFSCALLRQLGLCLIAWNYPRIYSRALEKLNGGESLDASIKRALGFSPSLLGLTIARKWGLKDEFLVGMGDKRKLLFGASSGEREMLLGETLAKICEVGEAFARANDPEHYPTAPSDWQTAQEAIASWLGPTGLEIVYSRAKETLRSYVNITPLFGQLTEPKHLSDRITSSQYSARLIEKNTYLRHLPEELRQKLRSFYLRFQPNKILKSNITYFAEQLAPEAGFNCGCIYLLDPERLVLSPAVKIGKPSPELLREVKVSSSLAGYDLIASAFSLKTPLHEEKAAGGFRKTRIAAALGQASRVGVLYLEAGAVGEPGPDYDPGAAFRALRQCLCDCLNLS